MTLWVKDKGKFSFFSLFHVAYILLKIFTSLFSPYIHNTQSSVQTFMTSALKNSILFLPSPKVDVTAIEPVAAFCSSDEEDDSSTLLYLPISPEIEEPEEGWGPEGAPNEDLNSKRSGDCKENISPKKKRPKTFDVTLENAPTDGWFSHSFTLSLSFLSPSSLFQKLKRNLL